MQYVVRFEKVGQRHRDMVELSNIYLNLFTLV